MDIERGTVVPSRFRRWILTVAACVLFCVLWLPKHTNRWVPDESWYTIPAQALLEEGRIRNTTFPPTDYEEQADVRPPAMPLTLAATIQMFGLGVTPVRVVSLIAAIISILLVYLLGTELAGRAVGAIGAVLTATDSFFFLAARTVRPEIYVTLFSILALLLYVKSLRSHSTLVLFAAGISAGIAINYHVNGIGIAAGIFALLIYRYRGRALLRKQTWVFAAGLVLAIAPMCLWIAQDAVHRAAFRQIYMNRAAEPFMKRLIAEKLRYSDFLGVGNWRVGFALGHIPLRAHIVLILLLAAVVLVWRCKKAAPYLLLPLAANLGFWVFVVNKSSRYFSVTAPLLALTAACAMVAIWPRSRRSRLLSTLGFALLAVSGILGDLIVLHQAASADYKKTALMLEKAIPPGESVLGSISFWMALHDRRYYSYDRTPFKYAVQQHVRYFILNDRVMASGSGYGEDDFAQLRAELYPFIEKNGTFVTHIPAGYYGDLQIYRVQYDK